MLFKYWNRISTIVIFIIISLVLFNIHPVIYKRYIFKLPIKYNIKSIIPIDPIMKDIYVPPDQNSHPKISPIHGRIGYLKSWNYIQNDNNIPGILPGPRPGNMLGLNNNPSLSLLTPIKAPLLDNIISSKYNFQQCNPYNGSYSQCTNNYIPLQLFNNC